MFVKTLPEKEAGAAAVTAALAFARELLSTPISRFRRTIPMMKAYRNASAIAAQGLWEARIVSKSRDPDWAAKTVRKELVSVRNCCIVRIERVEEGASFGEEGWGGGRQIEAGFPLTSSSWSNRKRMLNDEANPALHTHQHENTVVVGLGL